MTKTESDTALPKDSNDYYNAISSIVQKTSYLRGQNYFTSILQQFYQHVGTDYVFIGRSNKQDESVETIALLKGDQLQANFSYSLKDTPCDYALSTGTCLYPQDVCLHYPNDQLLIDMNIEGYIGTSLNDAKGEPIGILVALFEQPLENQELVKLLFEFFASQIATALINQELEERLEHVVEEKTSELKAQITQTELALGISDQLFEFSPDALLQVDRGGLIIRVNSRLESLLNYRKDELLGTNIDELVPEQFRKSHDKHREAYLKDSSIRPMNMARDLKVVSKSGTLIPVEISLGSVRDLHGADTVLVSMRDVTFRRNLEKSLIAERNRAETLARQKSRFLANMSHEIRTPMNGVLGLTDLLETTGLSEQQKEYLRLIKSSGQTLLTVINDILDYSKIVEGKLHFDLVSFDFRKWVGALLFPYHLSRDSNVIIEAELDPNIPSYLIADTARLHQLMSNLLNNAVKFTSQGRIKFKVELLDSRGSRNKLLFSVEDTGIGIDQEALPRIFDNFEQADISTTREYGGTGLGLAICKELVWMSKGAIWADSEPGIGSTFYVELTLDEGGKPLTEKEVIGKTEFSHLKVLLVEDNVTNQLVAKGMLNRLGIKNISLAENGRDAISQICEKRRPFDLVLMDCEMPIMDGYEATRSIRSWEKDQNRPPLKICALTAHAMNEHRELTKQSGMNYHLTKPLQLNKLQEVLSFISTAS